MDEEDAASDVGWRIYWGEAARPSPPLLGLSVTIAVPHEFYRSVVLNLVRASAGKADPETVASFEQRALREWCERYRARKGRASPERCGELMARIPAPLRGEPRMRLRADLQGLVQEGTLGRTVAARFAPNRSGLKLAMREALLEALDAVRLGGPAAAGAEQRSLDAAAAGDGVSG